MIIDEILNVFLQFVELLLDFVPALDFNFAIDAFIINKYLTFINLFFPLKEIMPLLLFNIVVLPTFCIWWTLILKIKVIILGGGN